MNQHNDSSIVHNSALAKIGNNSNSENHQKDFQAAWLRWFDEVDRLEPESPQLELDEYGKAILDKYKKQGLDL